MVGIDKEYYLKAVRSTKVFNPRELEVLGEVLQDCQDKPGQNYFLLDEKQDDTLAGFIIFGRIPLTQFSWDIYWLAVDKKYQGKGAGRKLLQKVEDFLLQKEGCAVLRVETSARKEYVHARGLYLKQGFKETGRIPDFYGQGDDLVTFYKDLRKA